MKVASGLLDCEELMIDRMACIELSLVLCFQEIKRGNNPNTRQNRSATAADLQMPCQQPTSKTDL